MNSFNRSGTLFFSSVYHKLLLGFSGSNARTTSSRSLVEHELVIMKGPCVYDAANGRRGRCAV